MSKSKKIIDRTNYLHDFNLKEPDETIESVTEKTLLTLRTITKQNLNSIEKSLFANEAKFHAVFAAIEEAIIITDLQGLIVDLNLKAEQIIGRNFKQLQKFQINQVLQLVCEKNSRSKLSSSEQTSLCIDAIYTNEDRILIVNDNREYPVKSSVVPIYTKEGQQIGTVWVLRDLTKLRILERQLSWQETHDFLTGLYNRRGFEQQLIDAIANAKDNNIEHAVCYLNLDCFKIVNDTCGYLAGDELLLEIATIWKKQVADADVLARLSADEFGLLLHQCSLKQAEEIASSLKKSLENFRFNWGDKNFTFGMSIGIVPIAADSQNLQQVLIAVDAACQAAKEKGRNCIQVYSNDDNELAKQQQEREWVSKINRAIEENRFCLYSQKITPIKTNLPKKHHEILLRLLDETGKIISPMAFLPAAERYGLMPAIDRWVIERFFADYGKYFEKIGKQKNLDEVYTINLSGASFNDKKSLDFIVNKLTQYQIPPQNICFEITETVAIANLEKASQFIQELKKLGISFALDDFGSGMSSMTYLKNLSVDYLKIDGSFVRNIATDPFNKATVECFNHIGHVMNIETIAEYVEDDITLEKLRDLGVDYGQGYAIAKPQPLDFNN
ncbi:MAG: EAL domain-containing protein [Xenococcaceae cyanobacterium]